MLEVKNISVYYGRIAAVKNLSFVVRPGEIVTFVGANGAGKTTTMRTLSGLLRASQGQIRFCGEDIAAQESHKIVAAGLVQSPEGRMVFADMTVRQNLILGTYSRKISHAELNRELEHVFELFPRLQERQHQLAITMSGGEQQMLAIARALMAKPKLLVLDEPSLGISPLLTQQIFQRIVELNRTQKLTILLAEQNAKLALSVSHRAYVLELGTVVKEGPAPELARDPAVQKAYLGG